MARDQPVVFADALAPPLQFRANLPGSLRIPLGVVEQRDSPAQKCREPICVLRNALALGDPIPKLMGHD